MLKVMRKKQIEIETCLIGIDDFLYPKSVFETHIAIMKKMPSYDIINGVVLNASKKRKRTSKKTASRGRIKTAA